MVAMTRARPASYGLGNPPPLDRWIDAVLMLVVCLVQGVRATFGMRRRSSIGDWHTEAEAPALPQTKPDMHLKEDTTPTDLPARVPGEGGGVDSHLKCNGLRCRENASAGVFQPRALRGVAL